MTEAQEALSREDPFKRPGIADRLGAVLKYQGDIQKIKGNEVARLLDAVRKDLSPEWAFICS